MADSKTPAIDAMVAELEKEPALEPAAAEPEAGEPGRAETEAKPAVNRDPETGKFAPKDKDGKSVEADGKPPKPAHQDTVPHAALAEARAEARRLKDELRQQSELYARLDQKIDMVRQGWQAPQKPAEPEIDLGPDPLVDPVGATAWVREWAAEQIKARQQWEAGEAERKRNEEAVSGQRRAVQRDLAAANQDWNEAITVRPELSQVFDALRVSMGRELQALGWNGPQLVNKLNELEVQHAVYAYRNRIPIADYVLRLAASRNIGLPQAANGGGNGAQPPAGAVESPPEPEKKPDAADGIKRLADAQNAAQTLSGAGAGSGAMDRQSYEALDRMSLHELSEFIASKNKLDPNGFEKWKRRQTVG